MTRQLELFGAARLEAVPTNGTATSQAAAKAIQPAARGLALKVFEFIRARGPHGATDEEGEIGTSIAGNTYRSRRIRLVEIGWVRRTELQRPTRSGQAAFVWVACDDVTKPAA